MRIYVSTEENLGRFRRDTLKRSNYYRKYHQSGPLVLNDKLNAYSQKYAEVLAKKNTMEHSSEEALFHIYRDGDFTGENLYMSWTTEDNFTMSGARGVDSWYDEIKDYDFKKCKSKNGRMIGHFTQLIWKGTTKLGVGVARSKENTIFVVCNYYEGGNLVGDFKNNVFNVKV